MFHITITFRQGPTIMDEDMEPVMIKRATGDDKKVSEMQKAAMVLDAMSFIVEKEQSKS